MLYTLLINMLFFFSVTHTSIKLEKNFVFVDDLWVVSKTLDFEQDTFIACSAFFGPSSLKEVELLPLKGYFPSNWPTNSKYYHVHFNLYLHWDAFSARILCVRLLD